MLYGHTGVYFYISCTVPAVTKEKKAGYRLKDSNGIFETYILNFLFMKRRRTDLCSSFNFFQEEGNKGKP